MIVEKKGFVMGPFSPGPSTPAQATQTAGGAPQRYP